MLIVMLDRCHIENAGIVHLCKADLSELRTLTLGSFSTILDENKIGDQSINILSKAKWPLIKVVSICNIALN